MQPVVVGLLFALFTVPIGEWRPQSFEIAARFVAKYSNASHPTALRMTLAAFGGHAPTEVWIDDIMLSTMTSLPTCGQIDMDATPGFTYDSTILGGVWSCSSLFGSTFTAVCSCRY
jgi:hypothetical protein